MKTRHGSGSESEKKKKKKGEEDDDSMYKSYGLLRPVVIVAGTFGIVSTVTSLKNDLMKLQKEEEGKILI